MNALLIYPEFPDTFWSFQHALKFIRKKAALPPLGLLTALPGTQLYARLKQAGRLGSLFSGDNADGTTNIIPHLMDLDTLRAGYKEMMRRIYSPEHYYRRIRTFLREYQEPKIHARLDWQHFLAIFRSIYHLGIVGQERIYYWRLLLWTLAHRPRFFPLAIALAINGYHFRRVCESHIG